MDRAVIFAIMRQESQFKPEAQSPVGARGLMQIMPVTASYVSGDKSFKAGAKSRLFDPDLNVLPGAALYPAPVEAGRSRRRLCFV